MREEAESQEDKYEVVTLDDGEISGWIKQVGFDVNGKGFTARYKRGTDGSENVEYTRVSLKPGEIEELRKTGKLPTINNTED